MTAKFSASVDGTKVNIGTAAEDALQIDSTAKTIAPVSPYKFSGVAAVDTSFTPTGDVAATNVQAAIAELDTEKVSKGVYESGQVIQQILFTDAGKTVSGTGFTDATNTLKNFTPKSTNSTIVIDLVLRADIAAVSALNSIMNYQIFEGNVSTRLGSTMNLAAATSAGGLGATAGVSVRASVTNAGLGSRNFGLVGWTNSGSASGSLTLQSWVITEIQN